MVRSYSYQMPQVPNGSTCGGGSLQEACRSSQAAPFSILPFALRIGWGHLSSRPSPYGKIAEIYSFTRLSNLVI